MPYFAETAPCMARSPPSWVATTIGDDVMDAVMVRPLETTPPDATHWSSRGLAAKHGIFHIYLTASLRAAAVMFLAVAIR